MPGADAVPSSPGLAGLVLAAQAALSRHFDLPLSARHEVRELLRDAELGEELQPYAHVDPARAYTRNLVYEDAHFSLIALCWTPGSRSPVHNHPVRNGCYMRVVQGAVHEKKFVRDEEHNRLEPAGELVAETGACLYIDDSLAYHSVGNRGELPAITLHIYAPPYIVASCWPNMFVPLDQPLHSRAVYHSVGGLVIPPPEGGTLLTAPASEPSSGAPSPS
jgi:cysteine dioxygenase